MKLKVELLAHTQLSDKTFRFLIEKNEFVRDLYAHGEPPSDGQTVSLAAIRQCYSHKTALEVLETESEKYFGERGKEGKRLFKQIVSSGHTSTLEHLNFTFAIEGVSRSLLAQLTRHRHMSFSVQSQRYVKFSSESRSGGFDYVQPHTVKDGTILNDIYDEMMSDIQSYYNRLIEAGIPQEDARSVLPNAASCNLVLTANLRTLLDFYSKRKPGAGAQHEITVLAKELKTKVIEVEPWTEEFFE